MEDDMTLPTTWEDRLICSDCFEELFPDANPFISVGLWSPTVPNFYRRERCWFCMSHPLFLDLLTEEV